jgi:hypothetical protein
VSRKPKAPTARAAGYVNVSVSNQIALDAFERDTEDDYVVSIRENACTPAILKAATLIDTAAQYDMVRNTKPNLAAAVMQAVDQYLLSEFGWLPIHGQVLMRPLPDLTRRFR